MIKMTSDLVDCLSKTSLYVVNGSGVSLEDFPFSKVSESKLNFLMISRLIGDKGVREYVEAGKILNKDNYVAHLHLVGSLIRTQIQ